MWSPANAGSRHGLDATAADARLQVRDFLAKYLKIEFAFRRLQKQTFGGWLGDPRIIQTTSDDFYLCTRPAAIPDMDATKALLLMHERTVKYLFVPVIRCDTRGPS